MIFEKPSLRTRVSFEAAMAQLGGRSIFLSASDGPIGQRESVADFARTLSEYVDAVVLRVFSHRHARGVRRPLAASRSSTACPTLPIPARRWAIC